METLTESLCYIYEAEGCENVNRSAINEKLFTFEGGSNHIHEPNWCKYSDCKLAQEEFYLQQRNHTKNDYSITRRVNSYFRELKKFRNKENLFPFFK